VGSRYAGPYYLGTTASWGNVFGCESSAAGHAFEAALKVEPGRFWSLYGAARAAESSGNQAKAEEFYARLVGQTASADVEQRPVLKIAKAFLSKR
jgi:hypothetical protein